jgi:RNA polymerase sigma-70 factor (ECF subfamily)
MLGGLRDDHRRDESWAAFSARYRDVILGWCVRRGLRGDDAEDLTQDVLLKLFQHLPAHRHDPTRGRFRSWLKAVVNNTLTDYWRRRGPDRGAVGGTEFLARAAEVASPDAARELSEALEERARVMAAEVVARVRARLKETTWQAFYQSVAEGRPAAEVAAALNLGVVTVYKATYRVKQMLLEEYNHAHPSGAGPDPVPGTGDA